MTYRPHSGVLLAHLLNPSPPQVGDIWRLRKGTREIIIDEVGPGYVNAHAREGGRRTGMKIEVLLQRYVLEAPPT